MTAPELRPDGDLVAELRELIVRAAPDPARAAPVRRCRPDDLLDEVIPFSSVIVLGTVVAVEDRFGIRVTRPVLARALDGGVTLAKLAAMVEELSAASDASAADDRNGRR
jgi:hypothetical protein